MKSKISKNEEHLKAEARRISIKEGCFATIQTGFGENYVAPFAVAINSSNSQIAMLTSVPGLLGPLSQFFGSKLIEKYARKKIVMLAVLIQLLIWIPIIALAFLFWIGIWTSALPVLLIVFFSAYAVFSNLGGPAWFSWMGDIVKEKERGMYFSRRNRICGLVSVISTIAAAFFLDFFKRRDFLLLGFSLFFFLAMLARLASEAFFKKQHEPQIKLQEGYYFSIWQFIKNAPKNNFGKFALFRAMLSFAVAIASPFFAVYMLRNLEFSYVSFMIVSISASVFSLLFMPLWGRFSDKFGNYKVMKITFVLIALIPIFWMLSPSPVYLALVPELMSGIGWGGFNLATGNYIYDCVTPQRRGLVISYYNMINGLGVFLGAAFGALLVGYIKLSFISVFFFVFLVSGIGRLFIGILMLSQIKEVRNVKKFNGTRAFKSLIFWPFRTVNGSHQIMHQK